jgi:glycosyltransferase involved in cell wall biosynthesis
LTDTKKIRIVHIITGLSLGGAETMLLKLLSEMSPERFENTVVSLTSEGDLGSEIKALGISVVALNMPRGLPSLRGLAKLLKFLRELRPDITQTWLYHADLAGLVASKLTGRSKLVWNLRCSFMGEDYYRGASGLVLKTLARLSRFTDGVIVNSKTGQNLHLQLGYSPSNWQNIPNGFDTEKFKPDGKAKSDICRELEISPGSFLIGLIGRFDPVKGHDTFLAAAQVLLHEFPEVNFVLAGSGCDSNNADLMSLIPGSIRNKVHLLGPRRDIPRVTAALDIANCLSIGEGFPNVVGEAMSCGVPCVVTDVGDCAEIVGIQDLVIPPSDPEALVKVWSDLLQRPEEKLAKIQAFSRNRIQTVYDLDIIIKQYENFYEGIIAN